MRNATDYKRMLCTTVNTPLPRIIVTSFLQSDECFFHKLFIMPFETRKLMLDDSVLRYFLV